METKETQKDHGANILDRQLERISKDLERYNNEKAIGGDVEEIRAAISYETLAFERSVSAVMDYVKEATKLFVAEDHDCVKARIIEDCFDCLEAVRRVMVSDVKRLADEDIEADDQFCKKIRAKLRTISSDYGRAAMTTYLTINKNMRL